MNYNTLKELLTLKRINVPALAKEIGMSKPGLYLAIEKERLTIETLEKIAEALEVPVSSFFNDDKSGNNKTNNDQLEKQLNEVLVKFESTNLNLKNTVIALLAIKAYYSDYIENLSFEDKQEFQKSNLAINIEKITSINWLDIIIGNATLEIKGNIKGSDTIYSLDIDPKDISKY